MTVALNQLLKGLDELRDYVAFNDLSNIAVNQIEKNHCYDNEDLQRLLIHTSKFKTKKALEYNSYIITLYGLLERFLESLVKEYLDTLCDKANHFSDLPSSIQSHHLKLTLDLFAVLDRSMYQHISKTELIKKLNAAYNDQKPHLVVESFQRHASNFRSEAVAAYFRPLGIENVNKEMLHYSPFKERVASVFSNPADVELKRIFKYLDDLIERRNDVAHGVGSFDLLDKSIFLEYVDFVEEYSKSLSSVIINERDKFQYQLSFKLGVIAVYDNKILCIAPVDSALKIGDGIVIEKAAGNFPKYDTATIVNMQIERVNYTIINSDNQQNIGLELDKPIKGNFSFGLVNIRKVNNTS